MAVWHHDDLTALTRSPESSFINSAYPFESRRTRHVNYLVNSHIHELFRDATTWHHVDLTAAAGAPTAASVTGYVAEALGTRHVISISQAPDFTFHVHEILHDSNGGLHDCDLTAAAGGRSATGFLRGYLFRAQCTLHVMYSGNDAHVHELWWDAQGGWHEGDLTAATGAPLMTGGLAAYMFDAEGTQHVIHNDIHGHIHELWWQAQDGWHRGDLTAAAKSPPADHAPSAYMFDAENTQHVIYRSSNGHIHELWWFPKGSPHHNDLTVLAGAPLAVGNPSGYLFNAEGTQHAVYRGQDAHIHEIWWDAQGTHHNDLTARTGAPLAASDPIGYTFNSANTEHVTYGGVDNHIHELWFG